MKKEKLSDFSRRFWAEKVRYKERFTVIDGNCYYIDDEDSSSYFRGFGGRHFTIKKDNGEIIETTNLCHNGQVPEEYRELLPNNAIFL